MGLRTIIMGIWRSTPRFPTHQPESNLHTINSGRIVGGAAAAAKEKYQHNWSDLRRKNFSVLGKRTIVVLVVIPCHDTAPNT